MWWLLSREVMRLKGSISREIPWDVMPDLFFYREPEEVRVHTRSLNWGGCSAYVCNMQPLLCVGMQQSPWAASLKLAFFVLCLLLCLLVCERSEDHDTFSTG